ncbi:hypothetical protein [Neomoorella thermoacetica]|uniref:Uncharacterized protein n=1 Tax=Neomoorella thermoacetica TaxID=1525 RepID=A0A1J5K2M2_NEOTH|nr:hypothetical protein [Moorella thermoacetica]OIQ09993.1 hypothetical protein MOOR_00630 [Moorella thermoacetica]OIQ54192.1 hypothetical protein MORE_17060 [Moorella thermoacetica]OIQ59218.1 hypothetical protein MTIN_24790 [Moorella thermoacetica]
MGLDVDKINNTEQMVKRVVLKTLLAKVEEINRTVEDLKKSLGYFEKKYGMATETFYQEFIQGILDDNMDFFEWKATKDMLDELKIEKEALLGVLK